VCREFSERNHHTSACSGAPVFHRSKSVSVLFFMSAVPTSGSVHPVGRLCFPSSPDSEQQPRMFRVDGEIDLCVSNGLLEGRRVSVLVVFVMDGIDSSGHYLDGGIMYLLAAEGREPSNGMTLKRHGPKRQMPMSAGTFRPG
jgi:hypothetical protein